MIFSKAKTSDLNDIRLIVKNAINHMKSENNNQWTNEDEIVDEIKDYIEKDLFYVAIENNEIVGIFALIYGVDDTYNNIIGKWDNNEKYVTIHKMAVKYYNKQIASKILKFIISEAYRNKYYNIRIDTAKSNKSMNSFLLKNGFIRQGIISIKKDFSNEKSLREAYLKNIKINAM